MKKNIIATIAAVLLLGSSVATADPVDGSVVANGVLSPGERDYYRVTVRGGEVTRLFARGDGDGDIDCVFTDAYGDVYAYDRDSTDTCLIDIAPARTMTLRVIITNAGGLTDFYNLRIY